MNEHIEQRMLAIQQALISQHTAGRGFPNAMIGNERETFRREFLKKVFPGKFRFGTGVITDSNNNLSGQVDIAIELPYEPSFPMPSTEERLYPAEAVGAVIEVKSNLATQWNEVEETVAKIKKLERKLRLIMRIGMSDLPKIPCYVAAYAGYKTKEALVNRLNSTPEECRPDGILVINPGYFVATNGSNGSGPNALFVFIAAINAELNTVLSASSNLGIYINNEDKTVEE